MKLFTYCVACKEEISIKSSSSTRSDLEMEKGEVFNVNCQSCGKIQQKHVNDIRAKTNKKIILGGVILGIAVTILLWTFLGAIGTVSLAIPALIWQQQNQSANGFNSYRVKRTKAPKY